MESQPKNPEFRINPENFHPCIHGPTSVFVGHFQGSSKGPNGPRLLICVICL